MWPGSTRNQLGELTMLDLWGLLIRGGEGRAEERGGDVKGRGGEKGKEEERKGRKGERGREGKGSYRYFFFPLQALG